MQFKNFEFRDNNHFVAMQYYGLILNRTFLILITHDDLIGIKVNGLISVEGGHNEFARAISGKMAVKGDLHNPYSYIKSEFIEKIQDCELSDSSILEQDKSNFKIKRADIKNAYHNPSKKWGMGYYPHDGRVYIEKNSGQKKEFIILGNQSGQRIANLILMR